MPRPMNEEKLVARHTQTIEDIDTLIKKRERETKALAKLRKKSHEGKIKALGEICNELFPERSIPEIAHLLRTATWHDNGHSFVNSVPALPKQSSLEKRVKSQKAVAHGVGEPDAMDMAMQALEEITE